MTRQRLTLLSAAVVLVTLGAFTPAVLAQQKSSGGAASSPAWTVSKTADGQPDLQGMWLFFDPSPLETAGGNPTRRRAGETRENRGMSDRLQREAAARRAAVRGPGDAGDGGGESDWHPTSPKRPSIVTFPENGKVPLKPGVAEKLDDLKDHFFESYKFMNSAERCITRGVPGNMFPSGYNNAAQIVQGPGYVAIMWEKSHFRVIPLDDSPRLPSHVRLWNGQSRGHFEGNTLVVDVTNFNDEGTVTVQAESGHLQGIRRSEALHVVERFTRIGPNQIDYEATVEDPNVYASPWKFQIPLMKDETYKQYEYACHEGNMHYMTTTLRAGRVQDAGGAKISESRRAVEEAGIEDGKAR